MKRFAGYPEYLIEQVVRREFLGCMANSCWTHSQSSRQTSHGTHNTWSAKPTIGAITGVTRPHTPNTRVALSESVHNSFAAFREHSSPIASVSTLRTSPAVASADGVTGRFAQHHSYTRRDATHAFDSFRLPAYGTGHPRLLFNGNANRKESCAPIHPFASASLASGRVCSFSRNPVINSQPEPAIRPYPNAARRADVVVRTHQQWRFPLQGGRVRGDYNIFRILGEWGRWPFKTDKWCAVICNVEMIEIISCQIQIFVDVVFVIALVNIHCTHMRPIRQRLLTLVLYVVLGIYTHTVQWNECVHMDERQTRDTFR